MDQQQGDMVLRILMPRHSPYKGTLPLQPCLLQLAQVLEQQPQKQPHQR